MNKERYKKFKIMNESLASRAADTDKLEEALNKSQLDELLKLCKQVGIKTLGDLERFMNEQGKGKEPIEALKYYLENELKDINFQAKDECLNEDTQEDDQFNRAVEAMKTYWNYDMSLEQLHKLLLKIYNNDAEKAFTVFATYGDAARRTKNECLNEDVADTWEEVAAKTVEDSDGFLTDYVWYTNGDKHVFIFGDSDIYRPEDEDFDWEIDVVEGKEAEAYKEAQDWFDSYNGFSDELNEAQNIYDIQGQAVRDSKRKEVLDEFKDIFGTGDNGEVNIDNEETLEYVRGYLEDQGYTVTVSESSNAEHPIHIEWFK